MQRYLISFDDGSMAHIPDEDWPAVGEASHAVVQEAKDAGVWIFGGGVERQRASIVGTDGAGPGGAGLRTRWSRRPRTLGYGSSAAASSASGQASSAPTGQSRTARFQR